MDKHSARASDRPSPPTPRSAPSLKKSRKLADVCYDIRGPVLDAAQEMERTGQNILKLNIGNPAAFGFTAPPAVLQSVMENLHRAQGYCDSRGLAEGREAVAAHCKQAGFPALGAEDIYLGNGVSELIQIAVQALINDGDELLIPAPDYPLWSAVTNLAGGRPVHYLCREEEDWQPDLDDLREKISPRTRGIVVINPNNPTGAVYSKKTLEAIAEIARQHRLVLFADEIYEQLLYDGFQHRPLASLAPDLLCISFSGLSKAYRLAGFRIGWMTVSGEERKRAGDFLEGLNILCSMRLCANVPAQYAVRAALDDPQDVAALVLPGGQLREQRDTAHRLLNEIPGVSCTLPKGAIYLFPRLDQAMYKVQDDEALVLDFLRQSGILLVQGTAFNWPKHDHLRFVFLPEETVLTGALKSFAEFLSQRQG